MVSGPGPAIISCTGEPGEERQTIRSAERRSWTGKLLTRASHREACSGKPFQSDQKLQVTDAGAEPEKNGLFCRRPDVSV